MNEPLLPLAENPWENVYWFARMLINGDKYGAVGKDDKVLVKLAAALYQVLRDPHVAEDEAKLALCKDVLKNILEERFLRSKSKTIRISLFCDDLFAKLHTLNDVKVLILTIENVMLPINAAMELIPSNDRAYTVEVAKSYLNQLGESGLATVINMWDDVGVDGCLTAERSVMAREFCRLREAVASHCAEDCDLILTAFVQEFERRLGQKRKARAGGSLEDVASFLFDYYKIDAANKPEHFQADIEVDKWFKCSDKWLVGISCKRTLRERWKQVSSASAALLSNFKISEIWHLITYDEDLSDDKITLLGGQRHIFYLRDDSRILARASAHNGMKGYVRPISCFIRDIRSRQAK